MRKKRGYEKRQEQHKEMKRKKLEQDSRFDSELATNYFIFIAILTGTFANTVISIMEKMKETKKENHALVEKILEEYKNVGELNEARLEKLNLKKEKIMDIVGKVAENGELSLADVAKDAKDNLVATAQLLIGDVSGVAEDAIDVNDKLDTVSNKTRTSQKNRKN